jgi:hypothetical protein
MAINYNYLIIKRTKGKRSPTRYGIMLKYLPKSFRHFLIKNRHIKYYAHSDQFVKCVYKMLKPSTLDSKLLKYYWDRDQQKPTNYKGLKTNYDYIDWYCAISYKPIRSKFMNFDLENFVHEDHKDILKNSMVDSRILKSSIEFRKYCQKLLYNERKRFFDISKKNAK